MNCDKSFLQICGKGLDGMIVAGYALASKQASKQADIRAHFNALTVKEVNTEGALRPF